MSKAAVISPESESIVKAFLESCDEYSYEGDAFGKKLIASAEKRFPGILKIYHDIKSKEKETAIPRIEVLAKRLSEIFKEPNSKACASCTKGCVGKTPTGCCNDCFRTTGHFKPGNGSNEVTFRTALGELKDTYGWDHVFGFWSKTGCVLPREKRSHTCLVTTCNDIDPIIGKKGLEEVEVITAELTKLRKIIGSPIL